MNEQPDPLNIDRAVLQIFPDHTDKFAVFETESGLQRLEVTAFASVMHLGSPPHGLPRIEVCPVVDEPDFGLITSADLEAETGWLLVEVQ